MLNGYIYKLSFKGTNKVYIGQTIDVSRRLSSHLNLLKKQEGAKKLQEAYNIYGEPTLEVILDELTSQKDLDTAEDEAISIYNSCIEGFNTHSQSRAGFTACYGELNGNSKFSNSEIVEFMHYMIDNKQVRLRDAATTFGMSYVTADEICRGIKHKWLAKEYPDKHAELLSIVGTRSKAVTAKDRGIIYPPIYSPEGIEYTVEAVRAFAREHSLNNTSLCYVLNKKLKAHKGWSLVCPTSNCT